MSQNVPWGVSDLICSTPRYRRVGGEVKVLPCGRIIGEAKGHPPGTSLMCQECERAAEAALRDYATGNRPVALLSAVHTLNYFMFRGRRIINMFARNYQFLKDLDGFKRWWARCVHPAQAGELGLETFIKRVREEYNLILQNFAVDAADVSEPSAAEIEAALGIQPTKGVGEPTPEEIQAALPGGGAMSMVPHGTNPLVAVEAPLSEKEKKARREAAAADKFFSAFTKKARKKKKKSDGATEDEPTGTNPSVVIHTTEPPETGTPQAQ